MKKLFVLVIFVLISGEVFSQITTTLAVNQPSATISEWAGNNTTIVYVVDKASGPAGGAQQVIIKAELKTADGTTVATTDLTKAIIYTLNPGTRIFYAKDVFPIDAMIFSGSFKSGLEKTGQLPAGTYQLSVQLVTPGTFTALTPVQTRIFNLTAVQLPYLITPRNNESLLAVKAEPAIIFRWTPLVGAKQEVPYYRLQVFEMLPYQQPTQALRGNQPLLDQSLKGQTQYIWRPQISFSTDTIARRFIWTIQTLNAARLPYVQTNGNGESRSEPFIFYVGKGSQNILRVVLTSPADKAIIPEGQLPTFIWIPLDPLLVSSFSYKIRIIEITGDESHEAFKGNKPFFEKDSINTLRFQYSNTAPAFVPGKKYAWSVQVKDNNGRSIGDKEDWSEFSVFYIKND